MVTKFCPERPISSYLNYWCSKSNVVTTSENNFYIYISYSLLHMSDLMLNHIINKIISALAIYQFQMHIITYMCIYNYVL